MFVRAVRSRQSLSLTRAAAVAAFAIVVPNVQSVAQQTSGQMPATHTVKRGDTLWDIAKLYLGDPFLWPEVYRLNTDIIEDPHWIYPGEVLKLPGAPTKVVAVTAPTPTATEPTAPTRSPVTEAPVVPTPTPVRQQPAQPVAQAPVPMSSIRLWEYVASPWVDQKDGPRGSGYIMQAGDLPGVATADRSHMQLYDRVVLTPPVGSVSAERELYLSYRLGPYIEDFGQIVIPTGVIEVTRPARDGTAAMGRVVKMFTDVRQGERLIPYDSSAAVVIGAAAPVSGDARRRGTVRWIYTQPVLPSLQHYVVVDISKREGLTVGDQIELFEPRTPSREGNELAIPEIHIARAQVMRVTQQGATAIIIEQEQPKIGEGTAARVFAKMP